jgi:hypothetical protein
MKICGGVEVWLHDSCPRHWMENNGPRVESASKRNDYQESSWSKGRPTGYVNNLTAFFDPIV